MLKDPAFEFNLRPWAKRAHRLYLYRTPWRQTAALLLSLPCLL